MKVIESDQAKILNASLDVRDNIVCTLGEIEPHLLPDTNDLGGGVYQLYHKLMQSTSPSENYSGKTVFRNLDIVYIYKTC